MKQRLLLIFFLSGYFYAAAQQPDSSLQKHDSIASPVQVQVNRYQEAVNLVLGQNQFLNTRGTPVAVSIKFRKTDTAGLLFYPLLMLVFLLALLRFFYSRYFSTVFRVFFNTSLRQGQLTDQLLQSKLPSLLFNIFFVISAGSYAFFLMRYYKVLFPECNWKIWLFCIAATGFIYFAKYAVLKFTGWVTGYAAATGTYVFIIFLISKILGIVLLPFTILLAFADVKIAAVAAIVSLLFTGLLLLLRFFRSYGLLQNQLKIDRLHFLLYLAGVEIIPLLLIYKGLVILLQKNL